MKKQPISIFIISLFLGFLPQVNYAQNKPSNDKQNDTLVYYKERYGLRVGLDLSKPIRSLIDNNYNGLEIKGDYRLSKLFYPAVELGHESYTSSESNLEAKDQGSYLKLGVNYNAYKNWLGMQNEIYAGLRYGFSRFSQTLKNYTVYDRDHYFPPDVHDLNKKTKDLNAHWIEFQMGVKAEVLTNLYLSLHAELKRVISDKSPAGFENLWIPGYNRNYSHSSFGIGWGYSITYLIPITTKIRKEKR